VGDHPARAAQGIEDVLPDPSLTPGQSAHQSLINRRLSPPLPAVRSRYTSRCNSDRRCAPSTLKSDMRITSASYPGILLLSTDPSARFCGVVVAALVILVMAKADGRNLRQPGRRFLFLPTEQIQEAASAGQQDLFRVVLRGRRQGISSRSIMSSSICRSFSVSMARQKPSYL
jgi:hypothetical protein